ncbi:uncharacterized protein LOC113378522 [Ctenocephalides felis]|uniref:uncharacterized protein LOC113378522 n=1 Tax=Ctenocephalides felis TaxID=7515 RepID=UPI000E6E25CB|nr:uncharacterized protein LOC113378522 [Ctenocephalides felis]
MTNQVKENFGSSASHSEKSVSLKENMKMMMDSSESEEKLENEIPNPVEVLIKKILLNMYWINVLKMKKTHFFGGNSNDDIIQLIRDGLHEHIGAEKLRGLLKILPEVDELDMLKSFDGDRTKLGNAEKFLMQLIQLPNYKLRIESMLLKEEFATNLGYLEPSINAMIYAGDDLMTNKSLQEVLYMVLVAGNFLNSGGYAGNAAGVKLSSLQKLTDIRANKPGMNLIHYVALQAQRKNKELLRFPDQMTVLESASKTTVEQLHNEINALDARIKKIKIQIDLPTTEMEIKQQMEEFLQIATRELESLHRSMSELESVRRSLSEFFCEDSASFKLEDCLRVFHGFCTRFRQAVAENERRRVLEERAAERRRQREEQLAGKRRQFGQLGTPTSDSDNNLVDALFYESRTGYPQMKSRRATNGSEEEISLTGSPALTRRRFGSFNSGGPIIAGDINRDDSCASPDVTPNGSLRRRRSRVLSEEDEGNLMEFLRASGHDSTRERKSWGSLDRSWARHARTGSASRKRPDLLSTDWAGGRERANSPSPLAEQTTNDQSQAPGQGQGQDQDQSQQAMVNNKPRYVAKEWRQKIESWLQANEKEDLQNQDLTRRSSRRIPSNRRSLEDSESERSSTLDPLPEGKLAQQHNGAPYKRVYTDWKTSALDKTDVVRTMEAIEVSQISSIKDKSAWRKSTLNVPNSTEDTEAELRRNARRHQPQPHRTLKSPTSPTGSVLNSIHEEDDRHRKNIIASLGDRPATDRLTLYMRLSPKAEKKLLAQPKQTDIDSDNIETPPATRRLFSPTRDGGSIIKDVGGEVGKELGYTLKDGFVPKDSLGANKEAENKLAEVLGDGQFDRFSSARRTRRYKRSTDYASGTDQDTSPKSPSDLQPQRPSQLAVQEQTTTEPPPVDQNCDKETRLKMWQERLKNQERTQGDDEVDNKNEKWPKGNKVTQLVVRLPPKLREHDLNDEGFEETQSLVSESPSQGTSSGCNYETDGIVDTKCAIGVVSDKLKTLIDRNNKSLARSKSMRTSLNPVLKRAEDPTRKTIIPRRSTSLRKTESQNSVERSNSRTSLRSSRSSLNSTASVNTVKKVPLDKTSTPNPNTSTPILRMINRPAPPTNPNKRPLPSSSSKPRIPASRSSSSGSSVGPTLVRKPPVRITGQSFKENLGKPANVPASRSSSSGSSIVRSSSNQRPKNGFMRPTTSSATKSNSKTPAKIYIGK